MFAAQQVLTTAALAASSVYAADLDGDGDQDVLSASYDDDTIAYYENLGDGSFATQQVITTAANGAMSVHAADLDGDGDLDVLSSSRYDDSIALYENLGAGSFAARQIITTAADEARCVYAADLDGDGDLDVLSASGGDDKIAWYRQRFDPTTEWLGPGCDDLDLESTPTQLNQSWDFQLDNVPTPSSFALFFFGSDAFEPGIALTSACYAYTTADLGFFSAPVIAGGSTFTVAIPADPTLIGYQLTVQATAANNSPVAFGGFALSNGLRGTIRR